MTAIKENEGYVLFEAFMADDSFKNILKKVKEYDKEHPQNRILQDREDETILEYCYKKFSIAKRRSGYTNSEDNDSKSIEKLKDEVQRVFSKYPSKDTFPNAKSIVFGKANIGHMLLEYASFIKKDGIKEIMRAEDTRVASEPATKDVYQHLPVSPYGRSIYAPSRYKTTGQIIRERIMAQEGHEF